MQKPDPLDWLLEIDDENPGIRYFALQDLLGLPQSDNQVREARSAIMKSGPVPKILGMQEPEGYWVKPGGGYSPKYKANTWSLLFLAELGADLDNEQIRQGCEYYLNNSIAKNGGFLGLPHTNTQRRIPLLKWEYDLRDAAAGIW